MRKTLLLAFQGWFMSKEQHLLRNYLINKSLNLWWYSYWTAKRVKTVPPGTAKILLSDSNWCCHTLCAQFDGRSNHDSNTCGRFRLSQRLKQVQNVVKSAQNFGQTKKAWENFVLNGFWGFLGLLSPNLKLVFCQKFFLAHKWNCCFCLSATVHTAWVILLIYTDR